MNYREAIEYLYSVRLFGTKLGLANTQYLLEKLGDPQDRFFTVHVAGTNGKGSVCAMLSSILSSAGYKVGTFTSPHILSFRERIGLGEAMVPEEAVCHHLSRLLPIMESMPDNPKLTHPTFFEIVTALATDYFAAKGVDVAVMETGMGGRLDATNALPSRIQVITSVGLEHTAYLGSSVAEIAFEKAGIIKEGAVVVAGEQDESALSVIRRVADEKKARLLQLGKDITVGKREIRLPVQQLRIVSGRTSYLDVALPLLGEHQAANCCLAIAAAEEMEHHGFAIGSKNIYEGLKRTKWPGRFEIIPGRPNFILDAACNPHACEALARTLSEVVGERELTLVVGILADKDYRRMCEILLPVADNIVLTEPRSQRALSVEELRKVAVSIVPEKHIYSFETVDRAISCATGLSRSEESFVCVAGSNYLLGPARKALGLDDLPEDFVLSEAFGREKPGAIPRP